MLTLFLVNITFKLGLRLTPTLFMGLGRGSLIISGKLRVNGPFGIEIDS
jgi:hypothetical protein